jgi:NADH:ubiquinone oxidoreductase subunit 4 (subunit M)
VMPILSVIFFLLTLASVGTPGSLNFWGEFLSIQSFVSYNCSISLGVVALLSVVTSAVYSVNLYNSIFLGVLENKWKPENNGSLRINTSNFYREINKNETFSMLLLLLSTWFFGVFTSELTNNLSLSIVVSTIIM